MKCYFFSVSFFSFYLLGGSYHKNSFVLNDQVEVLFYDFNKMYLVFPLNVSTSACSCGYVMWKILVLDFKFLRYTCTCNFRTQAKTSVVSCKLIAQCKLNVTTCINMQLTFSLICKYKIFRIQFLKFFVDSRKEFTCLKP